MTDFNRMKRYPLMVIAAILAAASAFASDQETPLTLEYEFSAPDTLSGWAKTKQLTTESAEDSLTLNGTGWDAKIYRKINLPAGYYLVSAEGRGSNLGIQLSTNWKPDSIIFNLNMSSKDKWRKDWRPLRLEKDSSLLLVISTFGAGETTANIKYLKIEQQKEPEEADTPAVEKLAAQRPSPEMVRGCTLTFAKNFPALKKWHANVTRRWIHLTESSATDPAAYEKEMNTIEEYLRTARSEGIKVVLVLGGGAFGKNAVGNQYWSDPALSEKIASLWKRIAERLLPHRDVIYGYDLYNEPLDWSQMPNPPRQWREAAKAAIKAIRSVDTETWIIYEPGPGGLSWGFADMKPLPDTRIIYSLHYYNPHEFTHQGLYSTKNTDLAKPMEETGVRYPGTVNGLYWDKKQIRKELQTVLDFQHKYKVPILVGEFSVIRWAPKADAVQYLSDLIDIFEEYQWSWIYHGFREVQCWSLEHDEAPGRHDDNPPPAAYETERAKVVKSGLNKNIRK